MSTTPQVGTFKPQGGRNFLRSATLVVAGTNLDPASNGLDLSELHYRFQVRQGDTETPNTLVVRIYNLSDETRNKIIKEYNLVTLQAGYQQGVTGIIFSGTVKQYFKGRENQTDTFLELRASDADTAYNFGLVNATLAPGSKATDAVQQCADQMGVKTDPASMAYIEKAGIIFQRGRVLYGLARLHLRQIAESVGARWSIQNGKLVFIPLDSYLAGDPIVMNSLTGLIGTPETTEEGINVRCLLNPQIQIGRRLQIDESQINQTIVRDFFFQDYTSTPYFANTTYDGMYRVLTIDHTGDTRGNDWYTDMVCLALDQSSQVIKAYP